jgi:hypothetical protein
VAEQPYSGRALLSSNEDGDIKGSLKTASSIPSCRFTATCWISSLRSKQHKAKKHPRQTLRLAAWNVRTLLDNADRHERRTAIISRELARYDIDIAALSETRISGNSKFIETGGGYTFYCIGQPDGVARQGGVGFAVRTTIASKLVTDPVGISTSHDP